MEEWQQIYKGLVPEERAGVFRRMIFVSWRRRKLTTGRALGLYLRASRPHLRPRPLFFITNGLGFILTLIIAPPVEFHPLLVIAAYGASISTVLTVYALLLKINRCLASS